MERLKLPISKSEAWRLTNQGKEVLRMKSWADPGQIVSGDYSELPDHNFYAIELTLEESQPFLKLREKFAWNILGGAVCSPMGLILTSLSFLPHPESLDFNYWLYRVIGISLLLGTTFFLSRMINQAKEETVRWSLLFDKYQVSDWKKTWR